MKRIIFLLMLILLGNKLIAQTHHLVLYKIGNSKDSVTIKTGDYVEVKLTSGKKITGYIPIIDSNYFLVGYDTVRTLQVKSLIYYPNNRQGAGKFLMATGGVLVGVGIVCFVVAVSIHNSNGLEWFGKGLISCFAGVVVFTAGVIVYGIEGKDRYNLNGWLLKIT